MHKTISPALKGLITSLIMIGIVLGIYYGGDSVDNRIQYIIYAVYTAGIVWTLIGYKNSEAFNGSFPSIFGQGFRCFIVVTLVIVLFTGIFSAMHPEFADQSALAYKEQLIAQKEKMPDVIDAEVAQYKKQYTIRLVSISIFGYLIIGAAVTALISALLTRRR